MSTKTSLAFLLTLVGLTGCGASTDRAESETHFLSCKKDVECEDANEDSVCVSGRCVAAEEALGDDAASEPGDDDVASTTGNDNAGGAPGDDDAAPDTGAPTGSMEPVTPAPPGSPSLATGNVGVAVPPMGTSTTGVGGAPRPGPVASMGPVPVAVPSQGQGGGSPAAGAGGTEPVSAGAGGGSGVGGASAGGTGGDTCEAFTADPAPANPVTITVRNDRDVSIVLGGPVDCDSTQIAVDSLDDANPGAWSGSHCLVGCQIALDGGGGCTADCPSAAPLLIAPGEAGTIEWPGLLARTVELPEQCCTDENYCPAEFPLIVAAEPGMFRAAIALTELSDEQATACQADPTQCPNAFDGQSTFERVEQDFELGAGPVELSVSAPVAN
jgi:hypothetical protein